METIDILLAVVAFALLIAVLVFLQPSELQVEIGRILKFIFKGRPENGKDKPAKKDQQEIVSLIRRYNEAVILALNHGDFGKAIDLCTGQGYGQVWQLYNDHYKDHQVRVLLESLEIISIDLAGLAKVDTREKWRYEYAAGDCSERVCVNVYQLQLLDDVWKVDKVKVFVPS